MGMGKKRKRIAIMLDYLTSEYSEELLKGIDKCCAENDVDSICFVSGELKYKRNGFSYQYVSVTSLIRPNFVDGVILISGTQMHNVSSEFFIDYVKSLKIPNLVNVSTVLSGIPSVISDAPESFAGLIDYLIQNQNAKKILFMSVNSISVEAQERIKIFYDVLSKHNISKEDVVVLTGKFDYPSAQKALENYYEENHSFDFDTIIALNDDMAFACIDFCRKLGLQVPEDVIVSGFDDLPRSSISNLPLTTVNQRLNAQGYAAAKLLLEKAAGKKVELVNKIPANAVLRASTERNPYKNKEKTSENVQTISEKDSAYEWFVKRNQLYEATRFYTDISNDMSLAQLKKVLNRDLPKFDVKSLFIAIYESPCVMEKPFDYFELPAKAVVFAAYDTESKFVFDRYEDELVFNPQKEVVPKKFAHLVHGDMICIALFKGNVNYGYMIFNKGNTDLTVYDILSRTISSLIASVFSYKVAVDEQNKLLDSWMKTDLMASTDELTGIKNRRSFFNVGSATMMYAEAVDQTGLVIFCDMDGLKSINDTYGHDEGDIAIKAEADILVKNFRKDDLVARIAGDEFAIICQGISLNDFEPIRQNIENDCEKWSKDNNKPYMLSISMGAQKYPSKDVGFNLEKLLSLADNSLYKIKKLKKRNKKKLK